MLHHHLLQGATHGGLHCQVDLGKPLAVLLDNGAGETVGDRWQQAQHHLAGDFPGHRGHICLGSLQALQQRAGPLVEQFAGGGQHHAAAVADKHFDVQRLFQHPDLAAERRLGHEQFFRGAAEAAGIGNGQEGVELAQVDVQVEGHGDLFYNN